MKLRPEEFHIKTTIMIDFFLIGAGVGGRGVKIREIKAHKKWCRGGFDSGCRLLIVGWAGLRIRR